MSQHTTRSQEYPGTQMAPAAAGRWHLPSGAAFWLQASIAVLLLAASSAPTPLYAHYEATWGFSPITVTVVFGIYAVAVLASLLTVGSLSDHIGRRPILLVGLSLQVVAMVVFATAGGVGDLVVGRVVQGLATGAAMGAVGAGLLDIDPVKGTVANGVGLLIGTGSGALLSSLLVQFLPAPTHLVYLVLAAIFVLQGVGVLLMTETSSRTSGALASIRPQFRLPRAARRPLLVAAPALIAVWSLAGFYASLGPAVVRLVSGSGDVVLGGLALFTLAMGAVATVLLTRAMAPRTVLRIGGVALVVGVAITLVAISTTSTALFFLGSVVAGVGFGGGFQGSLRTVLPFAAPHERSGVLSTIYVISYLALGLPAVVAGYLVTEDGSVLGTARQYGVAVMVLAALALVGLLGRSDSTAMADSAVEVAIDEAAEEAGSLGGAVDTGSVEATVVDSRGTDHRHVGARLAPARPAA